MIGEPDRLIRKINVLVMLHEFQMCGTLVTEIDLSVICSRRVLRLLLIGLV